MKHADHMFVDGHWQKPSPDGSWFDVINPATETSVTQIRLVGPQDVDMAVDAARRAFDTYSLISVSDRVTLLDRIVAQFDRRIEDLVAAVVTEMGSPLDFAREVQIEMARERFVTAASILRNYAFEHDVGTSRVIREPIGVCAFITPWNWPLNQAASKIAYALVAGCTMVWKPSEQSPLSAIVLSEMIATAGLPDGVFNMVQGDGPGVGAKLASHPGVDMVSFTGSTLAGIAIAKGAADTVKRVHQELGGKSANIILPCAAFETAIVAGTLRCFRNTGQSCQAPTRMLVPRDRMSEAAEIAKMAAESLKTGDPMDPATDLGPLVSLRQWKKVQSLIRQGQDEDAVLACGGTGRPEGLNIGFYVRPTVFSDVTNDMVIAREEIFGPVLCMIAYDDVDDAIRIANESIYGLAAYISANDGDAAKAVARRLRVGRVYINHAPARGDVPFGGYRQSGNGREQGVHGLEEFTELKTILS